MSAYHAYTPAQVAKGKGILEQKHKAIGAIYDEFIAFVKNDLGEGFEGVLHTDAILTHNKNRGGLLINAFNSHTNAAKVLYDSCPLAELRTN